MAPRAWQLPMRWLIARDWFACVGGWGDEGVGNGVINRCIKPSVHVCKLVALKQSFADGAELRLDGGLFHECWTR